MTPAQMTELIDLWTDEELPDGLRAAVEAHLADHPDAARDAASLRATVARLRSLPTERPDAWFVERTLDSLLRESAAARSDETLTARQ